jgi:hypothetical protein
MTSYKTLIAAAAALSALALGACSSMGASTGTPSNTSTTAPASDPSMSGSAAPADQPPPKP